MGIDYSAILKTARLRPESHDSGTILKESESDLSRILYSPALRRLQQRAHILPLSAGTAVRSELCQALQVAQVGRNIATQIVIHLEAKGFTDAACSKAIVNFVEAACLIREVGNPPFGRAGEAAIRKWFTDFGPATLQAACKTYGVREIEASDPRLLNALADFHEFDGNPQGLRMIAKLQWNTDPRGLNLTKTTIATYLKYLRMAGMKSTESLQRFAEKAGFFSTEVGLVKNVWSDFGYNVAVPQRFPLATIVEAANNIVSCLGDLEDAIEAGLVRPDEALHAIKDTWLTNYLPATPDPCDDVIMDAFISVSEGISRIGSEYSFADFRAALITGVADYAARRYIVQHDAVFDGTLDSLLPATSGAGAMLMAIRTYCKQYIYNLEPVRHNELKGYSVMYGLLGHAGLLLACSAQRFQAALDDTIDHDALGQPLFIEKTLLSLIPAEYIKAYQHAVAHVGNAQGRDAEFEEWNSRAHLIVDFLASMTESAATGMCQTLSGKNFPA